MKGKLMAIGAALVAAFVLGAGGIAAGAAGAVPEPKEVAPALEKQVLEDSTKSWGTVADAEVGQDINYRINVLLPDSLLTRDHVWCRIVDELPDGTEADLESVSITCGSSDVGGLFARRIEDGALVLEANELAGAGLPSACELNITYRARLTTASPVGGGGSVNAARLEVEADGERFDTPESRTAVMTYRLSITKTDDANPARKLAGARFVLSRKDGLYAVLNGGSMSSWTKNIKDATVLVSGSDGGVTVSGLDSDEYVLVETEAPDGYQGLPFGIPLTIKSVLSFDESVGEGRIDALELVFDGVSSFGDEKTGTLFCTVENTPVAAQTVPTTGDVTSDPWPFALMGLGFAGGSLYARWKARHNERRRKHRPAHMAASLLVATACLFAHNGCVPLRALAEERAPETVIVVDETGVADEENGVVNEEPVVVSEELASEPEAHEIEFDIPEPIDDEPSDTETKLEDEAVATEPVQGPGIPDSFLGQGYTDTPSLRGTTRAATVNVSGESAIPRSTTNSYINVLNMSYENAYVMVNDTTNFAYSGSSPTNTYINYSFGASGYAGSTGQQVSAMVLYRGTAGAHGAGTNTWGVDTIKDTSGKGLVAVWFRNAGVLSDTGEPVSMLLKLKQYQMMPNYYDYFRYMSGSTAKESLNTYRLFQNAGYKDVPLLYIFKSAGLDQTKPANARVWMNSVWCSGQMWEISFYRSSKTPTSAGADAGYSMSSLGLTSSQLVSTANNGATYLTRQYCYDLDVTGIRWLNPSDGSYSSNSAYVTSGNSLYGKGGAYLTSAGAESFAWSSGTSGSTYISTSSNLKTNSYGGLTYWLHDYNSSAGGVWNGYRWESSGTNSNTDWRNAVASDILPTSSFAWVGTSCSTGINLNAQFTGMGTLQINKTVSDGASGSFPFKITLESPSYASGTLSWTTLSGSYGYRITNAAGAVVGSGNLQSGGSINLANGQKLVVSGLPEGTRYTVTETSHVGYQPTQAGASGTIVADQFVGTIVNGATNTISVNNVKLYAAATWTIVKKGNSGESLQGAEFTVRYYTGTNASGTPARTWVIKTGSDGKASLDAAHKVSGDQFFTDSSGVIGLPVGTVTIEETRAPSGYSRDTAVRTYQIRDAGGRLESTIPATITVTDTRLTGSLVVAKRVAGTGASADKPFSFNVKLTSGGSPVSGTFGGVAFTNGSTTFTLKAGQTKTISGIPSGYSYEVSEASAAGYAVSWSGRTGTIAANGTATATATNTYSATGSTRLSFTKVFEASGRKLREGQFTFELRKVSPTGEVVSRAACKADGSITFSLDFDQESIGQTFTYYVTEVNDGQGSVVYDTHAAKAVVQVTNNSNGTLGTNTSYTDAVFTNTLESYVLPNTGGGGAVEAVALGFVIVASAAIVLDRLKIRR